MVSVVVSSVGGHRAELNCRQNSYYLHKHVSGRGGGDGANICTFIEIRVFRR
jgi:hypothetical protein